MRRGRSVANLVRTLVLAAASFAIASFASAPGAAQEVRVEIDPGPHYQGQPIELQIVATQFEEEPAPVVEFDPQAGISLRFLGVSPSSSTSISIVNGHFSRIHEVSFSYRYELTSARVGALRVPEFRVRQGTTLRRTEPFALEIAAVQSSDEFGISVVLPEGPIFVGQKVPVVIEFRLDGELQRELLEYRIAIPLFDVPGLHFVDTNPARSDTQLEVTTAAGAMRFPASSEQRMIGGRASLVVRVERTLIAQKPGVIRADAPSVSIERATQYRRDLFGQRQAVASARSVSAGRAVKLEVAEVPATGRPASFAGAVGSGFSLEVGADRSVVQLGEPIELSFHLRGHGDLSTAGLPPLDADGLFDPARFRLPEEAPAGLLDEDGKHFKLTLRVLDANVREIPALAYSWFDADTRRFETVHSQPIALSVGAARIVGADAVTSGGGAALDASAEGEAARARQAEGEAVANTAANPSGNPPAPSGAAGEAGARMSSLAESAANLAVERDAGILLRAAQMSRGAGLATVSLYGIGLALLGFGILDRRRRSLDPRVRERLASLSRAKQAVEAAAAPGNADGAGALGRALRELVAAYPDEATPALDALLAECDALRFAPGVGGSGPSGSGVPEALALRVRNLIEERLSVVAVSGASARPASDASRAEARAEGRR